MNNFIIIDKSSSMNYNRMASNNIITPKTVKENFLHLYTFPNKPNQIQSGIRESCEDIVCSNCNQYALSKSWDSFKSCKQKCFKDKQQDITTCCLNTCGASNTECVKSCNTILTYQQNR
jgi:hypothetical protein